MLTSRAARFLAPAFAGVALTFAACGGGGDSGAGGGSGDARNEDGSDAAKKGDSGSAASSSSSKGAPATACPLMTVEEVRALMGQEPADDPDDAKSATNPMGQVICTWGSEGIPIALVQLSIIHEDGFSEGLRDRKYTVAKLYEENKALFKDAKDVPGIGDRAFTSERSLTVLKGKWFITLNTHGQDAQSSAEALGGEMARVLERLEQ
ncbi:MAG: hypothetical protein IT303_19855 [Dehalococcoidia bacterium]|nr:hypothetical protein [Dehalococcoidia bacterium]